MSIEKFIEENPGWELMFSSVDHSEVRKTFQSPTCARINVYLRHNWKELSGRIDIVNHGYLKDSNLDTITNLVETNLKVFKRYYPEDFTVKTFISLARDKSNLDEYLKFASSKKVNEDGDTELIKLVKNMFDYDTEFFTNTIIELINIGYDVEHCNNTGESALSLMVGQKLFLGGKLLSFLEKIILEKETNTSSVISFGL